MQRLFNKRGADPGFNVVIGMVLGLVLIATVIGILYYTQGAVLNEEFAQSFGCWITNTVKCGGGVFSSIPSMCIYNDVEKSIDTAGLSSLLRDTWWMYKEGECDFGNVGDEVYPSFVFVPTEDIKISEFFEYSLSNSRGVPSDIEDSDFAYIHGNTEGRPICFDSTDEKISELYLEAGEKYYIMYYDDQIIHEEGDIILISSNPEFDAGGWQEIKAALGAGSALGFVPFVLTGFNPFVGGIYAAEGAIVTFVFYNPTDAVCIYYGPEIQDA